MRQYPVQNFTPDKDDWYKSFSVKWNGITIVGTKNSLQHFELDTPERELPVRHITEIFLAIICYDEQPKIYVTKIEDLIPLSEMLLKHKDFAPDIIMTEQGFKAMVKYNPADPTTDPILCKDCGT